MVIIVISPQEIANRIKAVCKSKSIAVSKMLVDLGLNHSAITVLQYRGTYPRLDVLYRIAEYLDVSIDFLVGRTENEKVNL